MEQSRPSRRATNGFWPFCSWFAPCIAAIFSKFGLKGGEDIFPPKSEVKRAKLAAENGSEFVVQFCEGNRVPGAAQDVEGLAKKI